jgi:NADH dehydrogenase FAD-containing subunit
VPIISQGGHIARAVLPPPATAGVPGAGFEQNLVVGGGFGGIKAALELSIPLMTILSDKKVKVIQGTAEAIDRKAHTLRLAGGEVLDYDVIIVGLGW